MKNKCTVELTDENNKISRYKIVVKDLNCKCCKLFTAKKFIRFLLLIICVFMGVIFLLKYENTRISEKNIKTYNRYEKCCNPIKKEIIRKESTDSVPYVCITIFFITGIICLTMLLIKDDSEVKLAKLEALKDLKDSEGFVFVKEDLKDSSIEETTKKEISQSRKDEANPCSDEITTKYKNLRAELAKTYMNSITEI